MGFLSILCTAKPQRWLLQKNTSMKQHSWGHKAHLHQNRPEGSSLCMLLLLAHSLAPWLVFFADPKYKNEWAILTSEGKLWLFLGSSARRWTSHCVSREGQKPEIHRTGGTGQCSLWPLFPHLHRPRNPQASLVGSTVHESPDQSSSSHFSSESVVSDGYTLDQPTDTW